MAQEPCSHCGMRYRRAATHVYPAMTEGATVVREHLRLCPPHALAYKALADGKLDQELEVSLDEPVAKLMCPACGKDVEGKFRYIWLTAYWTKDERSDYVGYGHQECGSALRATFGLPPG